MLSQLIRPETLMLLEQLALLISRSQVPSRLLLGVLLMLSLASKTLRAWRWYIRPILAETSAMSAPVSPWIRPETLTLRDIRPRLISRPQVPSRLLSGVLLMLS